MTTQKSVLAADSGKRRFAVLLLAHGTPDTVDEIPEYLKNVVSGRAMPQHVVEEIQSRYAQIGKSPLTEWTLKQASLLQEKIGLPVHVGMRNWRPYIGDAVRQMRADGVTGAVVVCLAPQNSRTSVGLYRRAVNAEAGNAFQLHFIDAWADHPRLVDAFADRLRPIWKEACAAAGEKVPVLFTAHSVPCRTIQVAGASDPSGPSQPGAGTKGVENTVATSSTGPVRPTVEERSYALPPGASSGPDPYAIETKYTAALVAERLIPDGLDSADWYFAFQSQGMSGGPWIGPTVEETLESLQREGRRTVVLQPIGFLCDHVEILYDIDIAFQATARKLGLKLFRPESLNASPLLIAALADLASEGLLQLAGNQFQQSPVVASSNQK
jgi:protoporphyrin/coproporphyrin ferrochelatase